jgi:archaellin
MKKILFLLTLIVIGFASSAQRATLMPLAAGDTLSESSSSDTVSKVITTTAGYSSLGIQVNMTKLSGTASGKAYLYSSLDGTNYTLTDSSAAFTNQTTNTAFFTKTTTPYVYYKVQVREVGAGTGTQSSVVSVYYVARRHD